MSEWISAKDIPPNGLCIVQLEKPMCGMLVHCATFNDNGVNVIGGAFAWDMPEVVYWMPQPEPMKQ